MRKIALTLLLASTLVVGPGGSALGDEAPLASRAPAPELAVGGDHYFVCTAMQVVKYVGLFTGNVGWVVAGAIAGGIACGMGW